VQPVTYHIVGQLGNQFSLFMVILITFYAGQLVWRERDVEVQQVHDTLPLPTSVTLSAKGTALGLVCATLMLVVLTTGVATQLSYGFTDLNLGLYLTELYGVQLVDYLLYAALALTVHAVVNHKYLGHFIVVAFFLGLAFSSQLGIEHTLWRYGSDPGLPYSAMNEYGHFAGAFAWHKLLWAAVALAMATVARLAWVRGEESTLSVRLRQARRRLSPAVWGTLGVAGVVAFGTGTFIYVNTTVWNTFRTSSEQTDLRAEYEKTYERYATKPQPRIDAADLNIDLYPDRRDARLAGTYVLVNDQSTAVDTVFIDTPADANVDWLSFGRAAETVRRDETYGVRLVDLAEPLAPGDSTSLTFDTWVRNDGFTTGGSQTSIVHNGTFIGSGELPRIGYDAGAELSDRSQRDDHGLDPEPRMRPQSDSSARMRPYVARDATWLDYEATVSTSADQVPLATGTRDSSWTTGGRRHVRFRTSAPTAGFFSFLSARYEEASGTWTPPDSSLNRGRPVDIEVFHHPTHDYNTGRMIDAVKQSLTYYTRHFGPYQSREVRIAEFPRYAGFAQSFLGTIPYSESVGFIARVDPETDIDYPYYITAHEMGHQWWGHQVVSGPVWGATMLVESLAQYSALMVMEETYGRDKMKRFLEYELDEYLSGRSLESREERPLMTAAASQREGLARHVRPEGVPRGGDGQPRASGVPAGQPVPVAPLRDLRGAGRAVRGGRPRLAEGLRGRPLPQDHALRQPRHRRYLQGNGGWTVPRDPHGRGPQAAGRQHRGVPHGGADGPAGGNWRLRRGERRGRRGPADALPADAPAYERDARNHRDGRREAGAGRRRPLHATHRSGNRGQHDDRYAGRLGGQGVQALLAFVPT